MKRFIALCFSALFISATWAQSPLVVSTHAIYLISKKVTQGVEEPVLLLDKQSGHDVQLTPMNRKTIKDASLVIWLGKAHEAPLEKALEGNANAISILDSGIIQALPLRNTRGVALNNTIDTHVWLDPNNAVRIGFFIAALRSQQYPENKTAYWNNAKKFANEMLLVSQKYIGIGATRPYWSYHDAYQYLERSLNLKFAGAMTDDPHVAPTIAQIKYLNDTRPYKKMCLLAEANASPSQYKKLGELSFQTVDESLAKQQDFVVAWQALARETQDCVLNARK
ncbi:MULTISPECIES: metal ABC transporter substrate-binding protein [unclassified Acinetobacter]|uniref:metal ABC transporter substrate-binding protein n=1 Tax=unclassified Acinetobacter TaxID=196816 RepID=UPI00257859CA|nr:MULTISPECIES: metal ABC transporter substrate-binding protein [unclassified Acinetobacter]MDM1765499.1 zinc ABC transporter substrate-binding protein [Acinetobacter sp. 226-1]MDM1769091.1 zinc ABC transporter substrate-binding protein [Acinetobacter sp. 226-4]